MGTSRKNRPSIPRVSTTELLLGLFSAVAIELNERKTPNIHLGSSCDILHTLQQSSQFSHALRYLDFNRIGDSWTSRALEGFFFQAGAWGFHRVPNPSMATVTIPQPSAKERFNEFKNLYGRKGTALVEKMAKAFLLNLEDPQRSGKLAR